MEDNPTIAPNPAPEAAPQTTPEPQLAPEPTSNPEPAPAPEPQPTPEPQPVPAPQPAPESLLTPEPAPTSAAPKKKLSGGLIGLIIGLAVLVLGGGTFAILYFTSHSPEKLLNSAVTNLLSTKTLSYSSSAEISGEGQSLKYGADIYLPGDSTAYVRTHGLGDSIKSMLTSLMTAFGGGLDSSSETSELMNSFSAIDETWWKVDGSDSDDTLSSLGVSVGSSMDCSAALATYQKHPFMSLGEVDPVARSTSGTAYKITFDKDKLSAFREELTEEGATKCAIIDSVFNDADDINYTFTIKSSLFGNATLTGMYYETSSQKATISLEQDFSSAPSEAKDIAELKTILDQLGGTSGTGGNSSTTSNTGRRNDYATLASNIVAYMTNNMGKLPPEGELDPTVYIDSDGTDPDGNTYKITVSSIENYDYESTEPLADFFGETEVYVITGARCEDGHPVASGGLREFAIYGGLDFDDPYCMSNM